MTRTVALIEWGVAALILVWFLVFQMSAQVPEPVEFTLGIVITSVPFALGLVLSLGVNGAIHFRRRKLGITEAVFLVVEALILVLFVVAGIADQIQTDQLGPYAGVGAELGHWLDWFMPLWVLVGPVALTITIIALVKRSALPARVVAPARVEAPPVA